MVLRCAARTRGCGLARKKPRAISAALSECCSHPLPTGDRHRSTAWKGGGQSYAWSTCPCTPPGWTRSRDLFLDRAAQSLNPNDFVDLGQVACRLAAFEDRYNAVAEPFDWTFGRGDDLDKLCARLDRHQAS